MKRKTLKSIACAAAITLALSVTACGGSNDSASDTNTAAVEDTVDTAEAESAEEPADVGNDVAEAEADVEEEISAGGDAEYASLEEAFAEPEVKDAMDEMISSMEEEGMIVSYEVSGNNFIVIYQITDVSDDESGALAESMEAGMSQLDDMFISIAEMFDEALGEEGACTVTVRCLDASDKVLFEDSYSAK